MNEYRYKDVENGKVLVAVLRDGLPQPLHEAGFATVSKIQGSIALMLEQRWPLIVANTVIHQHLMGHNQLKWAYPCWTDLSEEKHKSLEEWAAETAPPDYSRPEGIEPTAV